MEDLMIHMNYSEIMHVEADNLLFGQLTRFAYSASFEWYYYIEMFSSTRILSTLRLGYSSLAATPLNANLSFITASVLWIGSLAAILRFNDYLLGLGSNTSNSWKEYLKWLRLYACCRPGVRLIAVVCTPT